VEIDESNDFLKKYLEGVMAIQHLMLMVCSLSSVIFFLNLLEVGAGSPQVRPILELVILSR
jgi:hypothetical protein